MRTKALLVAAALSAAGLATSLAQSNVYSLNIVGYINVPLTNGYTMVANQLDLDGTGTNNTIVTMLGTNYPSGTRAFAFTGANYVFATVGPSGAWIGENNVKFACQPGKGLFVFVPGAAPQTATLVGNVLPGHSPVNNPILSGFNIVSSLLPISGRIQSDLYMHPANTDRVFKWVYPGTYSFSTFSCAANGGAGGWIPAEPNLSVGEAVFLNAHIPGAPQSATCNPGGDSRWCQDIDLFRTPILLPCP
jgi:hypothetical protein